VAGPGPRPAGPRQLAALTWSSGNPAPVTTYVEAGIFHRFTNISDTEPMKILWVYTSDYVTRTFADTGETVEHLSAADVMVKE
jgi:hypothetical protein